MSLADQIAEWQRMLEDVEDRMDAFRRHPDDGSAVDLHDALGSFRASLRQALLDALREEAMAA